MLKYKKKGYNNLITVLINDYSVNFESSESSLLKRLAQNDREVIEILYRKNFRIIQSLVITNNGTNEDARDIFQESMIVLYEKCRQGNFELNCQISTYLYSVARRLWLKRLSQMKRFDEFADSGQFLEVNGDLSEHEKNETSFRLMEISMERIGEPCKSLLEAFYLQKKGMQEIAENFGYTNADNAKNQKYKCLQRLKKIFFSQKNLAEDE